jgi:hypothetical protein
VSAAEVTSSAPTASTSRWQSAAIAIALAAAFVAMAGMGRRRAADLRATWPAEADLLYLPSSKTLRWLALGHTELASDLIAARANVYYGSLLSTKAPQRWLDQYLHTAIDLDPKFHRLYQSGAAMLVYYGGAIKVEAVEKANSLLVRGEKAFPTDWNLPFQLGFNLFFELPSASGADDPRVPAWRQAGVEALERAALFEGVPEWLPNLTARLLTKQGANELAIRHLEQAYATTSSEETRAQIRGKLELLQRSTIVQQIEAGRRELAAELARGYDYAPEAFTVIAGPRRPRTVTLPTMATPTNALAAPTPARAPQPTPLPPPAR